jgi:hypothetical protein
MRFDGTTDVSGRIVDPGSGAGRQGLGIRVDLSTRPIQRLGVPEAGIGAVLVASEGSGDVAGHPFMVDGGTRMDAGR